MPPAMYMPRQPGWAKDRASMRHYSMARMVLLAGLLALLGLAGSTRADWSFAVICDTRGDPVTMTGISPYLHTIAQRIASVHPDLVLVGGDLCYGFLLGAPSYADQFINWKTAMFPVVSLGIPVYPVRGNHENIGSVGLPDPDLKQAYYNAFGAFMPTNGPNNGVQDDQRGFTYSFAHSNVTFIALDQYFYYNQTTQPGYHSIDQPWLDQQMQRADSEFVVVYAHEPVFMAAGQEIKERFFGTDAEGYGRRSNFWHSLGVHGAQLYACGHTHHLTVSLVPDDMGNTICQLVSGNGGAPPLGIIANHEAGVDVQFTNDTHVGFALATVGTNAITIRYHLFDVASNTWSEAAYSTTLDAMPEPSIALMLLCLAARRIWR